MTRDDAVAIASCKSEIPRPILDPRIPFRQDGSQPRKDSAIRHDALGSEAAARRWPSLTRTDGEEGGAGEDMPGPGRNSSDESAPDRTDRGELEGKRWCQRGGPRRRGGAEFCVRTIPTRVGRTRCRNHEPPSTTDHPHAGGENVALPGCVTFGPGPSPRGWGEPLRPLTLAHAFRTIPTRVGRTLAAPMDSSMHSDHPHAGGENHRRRTKLADGGGPSPRGWGELSAFPHRLLLPRTIPTRVGRTQPITYSTIDGADHPHAGGENISPVAGAQHYLGPSPRGWGERPSQRDAPGQARTIPTRVGRTLRT